MNESNSSTSSRGQKRAKRVRKQDYKRLLEQRQLPARPADPEYKNATVAEAHASYIDQMRLLAEAEESESIAFQSVVVAALKTLNQVLVCERRAEEATISLAQREKLSEMVVALEAMVEALRAMLSAQGTKMLKLSPEEEAKNREDGSWWFALTETLQVLEESIERTRSLVAGQPKGGRARALSSVVTRLLHRHYNEILSEAEQWIG